VSLQCHEIQDFVKIKADTVGCGSDIGRVELHMVWARQVTGTSVGAWSPGHLFNWDHIVASWAFGGLSSVRKERMGPHQILSQSHSYPNTHWHSV